MVSRLLRLVLVLGPLTFATACMGGEESSVPASSASAIVLQAKDLAGDYRLFGEGEIARADVAPGPREDPQRFGRRGGWITRYRQAGSEETVGAIVVESRVDIFESNGGAEQDLDAYLEEVETLLEQVPGAERVDDPNLGDEALATTRTQDTAPRVVFFNLIWREGNVTASVVAQGFEGKFSFEDALELAQKQQTRIEAAAS